MYVKKVIETGKEHKFKEKCDQVEDKRRIMMIWPIFDQASRKLEENSM